ncbi:hypothetical protein [Actinomadura madurae]|uniref:hypothetical protein n=1 Tax=Actinomadura madurae TaxID=1993 RepID=UPI000DD016A2|nr:hypothetical protein [Actinomadura madurae]
MMRALGRMMHRVLVRGTALAGRGVVVSAAGAAGRAQVRGRSRRSSQVGLVSVVMCARRFTMNSVHGCDAELPGCGVLALAELAAGWAEARVAIRDGLPVGVVACALRCS